MTDRDRIAEILFKTWRAGNNSSFTPDDKDKPLEWLDKQTDKILGYTRQPEPSKRIKVCPKCHRVIWRFHHPEVYAWCPTCEENIIPVAEPSQDRREKIAEIIQAETKGDYLEYFTPPEPSQDRVEAVAIVRGILNQVRYILGDTSALLDITAERIVYEILKLFLVPELTAIKGKLAKAQKAIQEKRNKQRIEKPNDVQSAISLGGRLKGLQQAIDIVAHDQEIQANKEE